ncbi:MAG TPA: glycosyltransferase [Acidimicrobiia bacterium]|nr:glycosyltransferase [Acidimicrobiia bacterium]
MTSNGWGLGHLSRQIAIALAVGDDADVTMFSFSRGLPLVTEFGLRGEFCPGYDSPWIPGERWNSYVERRFQHFVSESRPDVVLFDGVAPYVGILNALLDFPSISAGWLRRGMWLRRRTEQLTKSSAFDFVVEPGDLASEADHGPTSRLDSVRVPPVSLLEVVPLLDREGAAAELGLDPDLPALLFALGPGQPADPFDARKVALHEALEHDAWQVGVVSSPLAPADAATAPNGVQLRGVYPLLRYLGAFDAAVSAAGYNSVHELIPAGVPSLLVPKSASRTDDQFARAAFLADRRLAMMAPDDNLALVRERTIALLGAEGKELRESLSRIDRGGMIGGATEVARILTSSPPTGVRETGREEWRQPGLKGMLKRIIGPRGVKLVQRALGRAPPRPPRHRVSLDPVPDADPAHLLFTSDLAVVSSASNQPVEHVLPGASDTYRQARRELLDEFYDVV